MSALRQFDLAKIAHCGHLVGVDEAGRGALAGPVVAAAVCLPRGFYGHSWCRKHGHLVNDSKLLTPRQRASLAGKFNELKTGGLVFSGMGLATVGEIEAHNILGATRIAMRRALEALAAGENPEVGSLLGKRKNDFLILIDGLPLKPFPYAHEAIVKGDGKSFAIAMASILAKVMRDRLMAALEQEHPQYGFAKHKGYGTAAHRRAILEAGPCPHHRALFLRKIFSAAAPNRQLGLNF